MVGRVNCKDPRRASDHLGHEDVASLVRERLSPVEERVLAGEEHVLTAGEDLLAVIDDVLSVARCIRTAAD